MDKPNGISKITIVRAGPEKAGVGGSSPSLATISNCLKSTLADLFFWPPQLKNSLQVLEPSDNGGNAYTPWLRVELRRVVRIDVLLRMVVTF